LENDLLPGDGRSVLRFRMVKTPKSCAYCGTKEKKLEKEHVIPSCLYPESKACSRVQRITVPSCSDCNRGWCDDEPHFRNVIILAGEPNLSVDELWKTSVHRSFDEADANRRAKDIVELMVPVSIDGSSRFMIFPGKDERVLRVVRKIIGGLSHFHEIESAVSDDRVWVDILKYQIPQGLTDSIEFHHREPDVIQYWYELYKEGDFSSVWFLKFYERCMFVAAVSSIPVVPGSEYKKGV
jgi:hypothetical protein